MSPNSILEIENFAAVLQNEFQPQPEAEQCQYQQQQQNIDHNANSGMNLNNEELMNVNSNDNLNGFSQAFSNGTMKQEVLGSVDGMNSLEAVEEMNIDKYVDSNSLEQQPQSTVGFDAINLKCHQQQQEHSFNGLATNNFAANSYNNPSSNYNNPSSNYNNPNSISNAQFDGGSFNYNETNLGSIESGKIGMEMDELQQPAPASLNGNGNGKSLFKRDFINLCFNFDHLNFKWSWNDFKIIWNEMNFKIFLKWISNFEMIFLMLILIMEIGKKLLKYDHIIIRLY